MKSLGVIVVGLAVAVVPIVGVAAEDDVYAQVAALINQNRGLDLTAADIRAGEVASVSFSLPAGVDAFHAVMDWNTNALTVLPYEGDNGGQASCAQNGPILGWTNTPTGVGNAQSGCLHQAHPGGVNTHELACAGGSFCFVDAFNLGGFFDIAQVTCLYSGAVVAQLDYNTFQGVATPTGQCFAFVLAFGALPPNYVAFDSLVGGNGALNLGGENL